MAAQAAAETPADTLPKLRKLLEVVLRDEHRALDNTPWTNLSAAIGFVAWRRGLSDELKKALHRLRVAANLVLHESYAGTPVEVAGGLTALALLLKWLTGEDVLPASLLPPDTVPAALPRASATLLDPATEPLAIATAALVPDLRVFLLTHERDTGLLLVEPDPASAASLPPELRRAPQPWAVQLPAAYTDLLRWVKLRPTLRLLDSQLLAAEAPVTGTARARPTLAPRRVVLEPDYLISVTTVAECLQRDGAVPELALVNAFLPDEASRALVIGNLVNSLLDEEIREAAAGRDLNFDDWVRTRLFRQNPLQISALAEFNEAGGVQKLIEDLRRQHDTLRAVRQAGFRPDTAFKNYTLIEPQDSFLEPSFLSARYGLQGRLDLLHESADSVEIVELKSGKPEPSGGTWRNHAAQAVLYRLLMEQVFGAGQSGTLRGRSAILYSAAGPGDAVRPVGSEPELLDQVISTRNTLVARELALATCRTPAETEWLLRPVLHPGQFKLPPFTAPKAEKVANAWAEADEVERAYALELVRFTARELRVCLLGDDARPGDVGGQAGLWALPDGRKQQNFSLLDGLTLESNHADDDATPHLLLRRPADGTEVNFRAGDTLLLYPRTRASAEPAGMSNGHRAIPLTALDSQVVKVTLEEITAEYVRLSVRNRRIAPTYLSRHATWALEPDCFDTFRREWAGVATFLTRPVAQRRLLLGRQGPRRPESLPADVAPARTATEVVERALAAPDWFLLCGPPGTGKTKKVLRTLAERLHADRQNVLLAAYTNRAVDEICEQLVDAGLSFIRLGSRLSTEEAYRPYLLDAKLAACRNRVEVRRVLQACPIYVGTVSSLLGKPELFQFKPFDVLVVDEASQILEAPMLALLGRVPKWILIGDHKQLPAVVTQDVTASAVAAPVAELLRTELGLTNMRNSYFERLFRLAEQHWPWAQGTLATQYRLHEDLTELVNGPFYDGVLTHGLPRQSAPFDRTSWSPATDALGQRLRGERRFFVPTRRAAADASAKESRQEAQLAARLAGEIAQGYGAAFRPADTVGIIASFRNQVALIRRELAQVATTLNLPALNEITVDTVERYQGSQRDVIIVSFCCHFEHQLETLVSLDETGRVDRKLNVALTRAKEQLILLGNEEILRADARYRAVLEQLEAVVA